LLVEAAQTLKLKTQVLAASKSEPAAPIADHVFLSSEPEAMKNLFLTSDVVTIENEFLKIESLRSFAEKLRPFLEHIQIFQDKLLQKECFKKHGLPHLEAKSGADQASVLKWNRLGYDGKGTLIESDTVESGRRRTFIEQARSKGVQVFYEEKISFVRELAITAVRSTRGEVRVYPVTITEQKNGICYWSYGPSEKFGVSKELTQMIQKDVARWISEIQYVGALTLELFELSETRDGKNYLVNELAPRVHNSAHNTMVQPGSSQFTNHVLSLFGEPLRAFEPPQVYYMFNWIAESSGKLGKPEAPPVGTLCWYCKEEHRPGRKMGHVYGALESSEDLSSLQIDLELWKKQAEEKMERGS